MRTYSVITEHKDGTRTLGKVRARSNNQALIEAANHAGIAEAGERVRVFQGGYGYDSGWKVKRSKYLAVYTREGL